MEFEIIFCTHCGHENECPDYYIGNYVSCMGCEKKFLANRDNQPPNLIEDDSSHVPEITGMNYEELISWQFAEDLPDEWLVAVAGNPSKRKISLNEIKKLKDNAPNIEIKLIHFSYANVENASWVLFESEIDRQPKPPEAPIFDEESGLFNANSTQMKNLATKALQAINYTVLSASEDVVSFKTGMTWGSFSGVTGSLVFTEAKPYWFEVEASGKQNLSGGQLVALDWGESKKIANKVLSRMKQFAC